MFQNTQHRWKYTKICVKENTVGDTEMNYFKTKLHLNTRHRLYIYVYHIVIMNNVAFIDQKLKFIDRYTDRHPDRQVALKQCASDHSIIKGNKNYII